MTDSDSATFKLAQRLGECLKQRGLLLVTAESCTGGRVGQAVTAVQAVRHGLSDVL